MDWTKHETLKKQFITIEEALYELDGSSLDIRDVKEIINATIDDIIAQSGMDTKAIKAFRDFLRAISKN